MNINYNLIYSIQYSLIFLTHVNSSLNETAFVSDSSSSFILMTVVCVQVPGGGEQPQVPALSDMAARLGDSSHCPLLQR
jgi:hypothetical protein